MVNMTSAPEPQYTAAKELHDVTFIFIQDFKLENVSNVCF